MIGYPFDLEARMGLSARLDRVVRVSVALYRLRMADALGRPLADTFPLYYPGMPAYDAARALEQEG